MKTLIKSKEMKEAGSVLFIAVFVLIASLTMNVNVSAAGSISNEQNVSMFDQTPMYSDPKYTNENLTTTSTADQNKLNAPPPKDPDNQIGATPVSSSILPLLAMVLGLTLWKLHFQFKKAKK